jgi:hypothetical protein
MSSLQPAGAPLFVGPRGFGESSGSRDIPPPGGGGPVVRACQHRIIPVDALRTPWAAWSAVP